MWKQGIAVGFWLGLLSGLLSGATVMAKPADLPSQGPIECDDCQEGTAGARKFSLKLGITSKGITLDVEDGPLAEEPVSAIDAFLPAFIEQWLEHAADAVTRPDRRDYGYLLSQLPYVGRLSAAKALPSEPVAPKVVGADPKSDKVIRQLFENADLYRRSGLYEAARYCFQRVHLLAPTSRLGQLAIERLGEIENRLREAEQSEPSQKDEPEASNRDIRNGTMPLGLVVVTY